MDALTEATEPVPSTEPLKISTVRFLGREIERDKLGTVFYGSVGFLVCLNAIGLPYLLPCLRRYCGAPFLPSKRVAVTTLFDELYAMGVPRGSRLVDFGSGDGRIVLEARKRGFESVGIELNPWLVGYSRMKLFRDQLSARLGFRKVMPSALVGGACSGGDPSVASASFILGNMWQVGPRVLREAEPAVVTIYGLPGEVISRFGSVLDENLPSNKPTFVVSNQYKIPLWTHREIGSVNGFHIYKKQSSKI